MSAREIPSRCKKRKNSRMVERAWVRYHLCVRIRCSTYCSLLERYSRPFLVISIRSPVHTWALSLRNPSNSSSTFNIPIRPQSSNRNMCQKRIFSLVPKSSEATRIVKLGKNSRFHRIVDGTELPSFKLDHVSRHRGRPCFLAIGCFDVNNVLLHQVILLRPRYV